jgi:hypothetical protein
MNLPEDMERTTLDDPEASRLVLLSRLSEAKTKTLEDPSKDKNTAHLLEIIFNQSSFLLGRFSAEFKNQIDLSYFGGQKLGVSRLHAQLHREGETIYISDLNSRNGTFLDGKRIAPHHPTILKSGTYVTLGRLELQLRFKLSK